VVGLDRFALLGSERLEKLDRRSLCRRLEDLDRLVVELDRLHRERASRFVLNAIAAPGLAPLVARNRKQPRLRRLWSGLKAR